MGLPPSGPYLYHGSIGGHLARGLPAPALAAGYLALAAAITWPAALEIGSSVPGAERSDLWNSLWSLWMTAGALGSPSLHTDLLGAPDGGVLLPADGVNGLLAAPLIAALDVASAWALLVLGHLAFSGAAAHALARRVWGNDRAGLVAGVGFLTAPILISGVHNGTSEAMVGGWLALGALALIDAAERGGWRIPLAGGAMALAAAGSWYAGLCLWIFWALALLLAPKGLAGNTRARLAGAGALGSALALPLAAAVYRVATHPDNLLSIKEPRELALVRRSIGAADPRGWFTPGDFRSPDFERVSAYAEQFIHCHYLGWVLLIASAMALGSRAIRSRSPWIPALAAAGLAGAVAAMGPVLVIDGFALILDDRLAIPLPYFLVDALPGFSSLSLLYRLAALPALAVAVMAGGAVAARPPRAAIALAIAVGLELRLLSPVAGLPELQDAALPAPLYALAEAPPGAVMNFPVVGGRAYLYEQTAHGKPLAAILNFPVNRAARGVWKALQQQGVESGAAVAKRRGIRYLVVHLDPTAPPGMYDGAVRAIRRSHTPLAADDELEVYALW